MKPVCVCVATTTKKTQKAQSFFNEFFILLILNHCSHCCSLSLKELMNC